MKIKVMIFSCNHNNLYNKKHRTCTRQIVRPSDRRNKTQEEDEIKTKAVKSRMAVNRCYQNIKYTLMENYLTLQERVKVLEKNYMTRI